MKRKSNLFVNSAIALLVAFGASGVFGPKGLHAQEAIATQTLPQIAPAPETPFARALIRLDDLEAQIRVLTDRLERAEAEISIQKSENARLAKLLDETKANSVLSAQKSAIESGAATPEIAPAPKAETIVAQETKTPESVPTAPKPDSITNAPVVGNANNQSSAPPTAAVVVPKPAPAAPPPAALKPAPIMLSEARLMLQRSEFAAAENHLNLMTTTYPDAIETPEGLWLLGETRFVQKDYNAAALAYVAYLGKAPNGMRVSDTLLRLSSSFREIGDNRQRCLAFKEYQKRTPTPTPLQRDRANAELAKGPCS